MLVKRVIKLRLLSVHVGCFFDDAKLVLGPEFIIAYVSRIIEVRLTCLLFDLLNIYLNTLHFLHGVRLVESNLLELTEFCKLLLRFFVLNVVGRLEQLDMSIQCSYIVGVLFTLTQRRAA